MEDGKLYNFIWKLCAFQSGADFSSSVFLVYEFKIILVFQMLKVDKHGNSKRGKWSVNLFWFSSISVM
jgi:hypothetical protein